MPKIQELKIEPFTEDAFRPFGWVMSAADRPADESVDGGLKERWKIDFHTAGTVNVGVNKVYSQGLTFSKLERHFNVTQSGIPMDGPPAVIAVAAPTDPNDRQAIPRPDDVRAFLLDGKKGYALKKGTWHALNRYPIYPGAAIFIILSDAETSADLELGYAGNGGFELSQEVDYESAFDVTFEFVL